MVRRIANLQSLILIVSVTVLSWFSKGLIFAGGEEGIVFYNLNRHRDVISNLWYEDGTGFPAISFVTRLPYFTMLSFLNSLLPSLFLQALTFLSLAIIGSAAIYLLVQELFKNKEAAFYAGLFYFFNPYSMTQVWGRGLYFQFFSFALTPLILLLFVKLLKRGEVKYIFFANLICIIFSSAFTVITQVVVLWVPVIVFSVFYVTKNKDKLLHTLIYLISLGLSWLFTSAWWVIPNFLDSGGVYSAAVNTKENLDTLLGVSPHFTLSYVLRLMQKYYFDVAKSYGEVYASFGYTLISWLAPTIAALSYFSYKKNDYLKYFFALFIIGLLVSLGANPPFGEVFIAFFKAIPFLQAFRNPYEKFGLVYMLAYSPLFAFGLLRVPKFARIPILALVCVVFVMPLWKGRFSGKYSWTSVPIYYKAADSWLEEQENDARIMQIPLIAGEGVKYNWEFPYLGVEPGNMLFSRQSIGRNLLINKPYYNVLLQRFGNFSAGSFGPDPDLTTSEFRSEELWQELAKLNVSYIVFHNDLDDASIGSQMTKADFKTILSKEAKIKFVQTFGELDIYEVDKHSEVAMIYSPNTKVEYTRLSPTSFTGSIENNGDESVELYFLNSYGDDWELYVGGEKMTEHFKVFSYANAWKVSKKGNLDFEIKYKPQEKLTFGIWISIISTTLLGILSLRKAKK